MEVSEQTIQGAQHPLQPRQFAVRVSPWHVRRARGIRSSSGPQGRGRRGTGRHLSSSTAMGQRGCDYQLMSSMDNVARVEVITASEPRIENRVFTGSSTFVLIGPSSASSDGGSGSCRKWLLQTTKHTEDWRDGRTGTQSPKANHHIHDSRGIGMVSAERLRAVNVTGRPECSVAEGERRTGQGGTGEPALRRTGWRTDRGRGRRARRSNRPSFQTGRRRPPVVPREPPDFPNTGPQSRGEGKSQDGARASPDWTGPRHDSGRPGGRVFQCPRAGAANVPGSRPGREPARSWPRPAARRAPQSRTVPIEGESSRAF